MLRRVGFLLIPVSIAALLGATIVVAVPGTPSGTSLGSAVAPAPTPGIDNPGGPGASGPGSNTTGPGGGTAGPGLPSQPPIQPNNSAPGPNTPTMQTSYIPNMADVPPELRPIPYTLGVPGPAPNMSSVPPELAAIQAPPGIPSLFAPSITAVPAELAPVPYAAGVPGPAPSMSTVPRELAPFPVSTYTAPATGPSTAPIQE